MWKEIFSAFRHKDVVMELSERIGEMLDAAGWMFEQASAAILHQKDVTELADPLYERDRQINKIEQEVRERILTHLSVGNDQDMGPGLVLMSVVKDAERIGDYCKNIFEVGAFRTAPFAHREFSEPLEKIRTRIASLFEPVKRAFLHSDRKEAKRVLAETAEINTQCDLIIRQLLSLDEGFPAGEAVAYVLLARHYKRVEAHLSNIASSMVLPFQMLDFRSKKS